MRAVIFDMDGLLIDSEPLWRLAEREVFAEVGLQLTDADCERTTGLRTDDLVGFWFDLFPWSGPSQESICDAINARAVELIEQKGTALPGAVEAVEAARSAGFAVGLATSSFKALIVAVVHKLGLETAFDVTASGSDERAGKPDPAVYLTAARRLGIPTRDCVAVEDSAVGVRSALAAGMRVIAVPAPHHFHLPGFDDADLKLHSLEDFSVEMLRKLA